MRLLCRRVGTPTGIGVARGATRGAREHLGRAGMRARGGDVADLELQRLEAAEGATREAGDTSTGRPP